MHKVSTVVIAIISSFILGDNGALAVPLAGAQVTCSKAKPFPKHQSCGHRGHLKHPNAIGDVQFLNLQDCANTCGRLSSPNHDEGCVSFGWEPTFSICRFYGKTLEQQGPIINGDKNRQILFNLDCYNCTPQCPQPLGVNLLSNGGFEDYHAIGPWLTKGNGGNGGGLASPGYHSPQLYGSFGTDPYISQFFQTCKGHQYKLTYDWKINSTNPEKLGMIQISTQEFAYSLAGTGKWEHAGRSFKSSAPSNKEIDNLGFHFVGAEDASDEFVYFLDNVSIERTE